MTGWVYTARTASGETRRGEMDLPTREDVVAHLRRERLVPVSIREKPREISIRLRSRTTRRDVVLFTRKFATMIDAGLSLVQALKVLAGQEEDVALRTTIQDVVFRIESGGTLTEALTRHPDTFSPLYLNLVEAGEQGGVLDVTLTRLAGFLEKDDAHRRKLRQAMIYPSAILAFALLVVIVLLAFVIPTFQEMLVQFDQPMPLPTQLVIALSAALRGNAPWAAGTVAVAGVGLRRWSRTPQGERAIDGLLLRAPILGDLIRKAVIARVTRTLGTLLGSGVPILRGLELTAATADNGIVEDAVLQSRSAIAGGDEVSLPLARTGVFPPMVIQMIGVGERTGELATMLHKVAEFYEDEVDAAVESLLKLVEPALIVVLGVVVGGMIVAMYLPIFSLVDAVGT